MPLEVMTRGDITISSPGMDNPITLTFGIGSVMKSEEFGKLIDQLLGKESSKLREIFQARNKEKSGKKEAEQVQQLDLTAAILHSPMINAPKQPSFDPNVGFVDDDGQANTDAIFDQACDAFFGSDDAPPQPDPRDIELANAANMFDGKVIASGDEMGQRGFKMLVQAGMSVRPDLQAHQAETHIRNMLINDFQVNVGADGLVSGLTEDKYFAALGRIQKAKRQA